MAPDLDRTLLAAPPLIVTLAQVRFEEHAQLVASPTAAALREPMAQLGLPVLAQVHHQQVMINADPGSVAQASQRVPAGWQFKSTDEQTVVSVMTDQMTLETRHYPGWEVFERIWRACLAALAGHVSPQLVTRLGLRYVNRVRPKRVHTAAEWHEKDLVDPTFLGPAAGSPLSGFITTAEGRASVTFADGVDALIHHGVLVEGKEQVFVLDIDCFTTTSEAFSIDAVVAGARVLNDHSLEVFQSVVREPLRLEMLEGRGAS